MLQLKFKVRFLWVWACPFSVCVTFSSPYVSKTSVFPLTFEVSGKGEGEAERDHGPPRFGSRKAEEWRQWNGVWQPR